NEALKGVGKVLLISGMDDPQKRIQQHRNVIEAAKQNGVTKIVYTSIVGDEDNNAFSPVVQSNRQTEKDLQNSGLDWAIGRNGIYIEPDLEYIDNYKKEGEIRNCAGEGKCTYTSRKELGYAYTQMLIKDDIKGEVYNLVGDPITQQELADLINKTYKTDLIYTPISYEDYKKERVEELGDFIGNIIAGIYKGISEGANDVHSDFEKVTGRAHKSTIDIINEFNKG
ncbi:MAG: NAD(P)H-binding protein, partial [Candidatus Kapaibacterium sp.]